MERYGTGIYVPTRWKSPCEASNAVRSWMGRVARSMAELGPAENGAKIMSRDTMTREAEVRRAFWEELSRWPSMA